MPYLLDNTPMNYAWGDRSYIANLRGLPAAAEPEAELWFGDHPKSPSILEDGLTLDALLAPQGIRLPYLVKLLAAAAPLSLQVHPNLHQAKVGFAAERDLPFDSPARNYRDDNHKPEMIVALSEEFDLLCGFRPAAEIAATIDQLAQASPEFAAMRQRCAQGLDQAVAWLLTEASAEAIAAACRADLPPAQQKTLAFLQQHYPQDPGVIMALLMNHLTLQKGQAIYFDAGVVHAYMRGFGIEVMGNSDNVIRCGLTPKHIDVDELLKIAVFQPQTITPWEGEVLQNEAAKPRVQLRLFDRPDFRVQEISLRAGGQHTFTGTGIFVTVAGVIQIAGQPRILEVKPGFGVFISDEQIAFSGEGLGYLITV